MSAVMRNGCGYEEWVRCVTFSRTNVFLNVAMFNIIISLL